MHRTRCDQDSAQACTSNTIEGDASEQRETQQCVMDTDNVKCFTKCSIFFMSLFKLMLAFVNEVVQIKTV
uniref:Uncharacterized protein n=1 Tax=Anguilla anguilla TaxID=7936 RepID=A0A0E9VDJ0_ANGAN